MTVTHRSARLIAGRCRRFITATRARRGCGSFCPGSRGEEGPRAAGLCPCQGRPRWYLPSARPGSSPRLSSKAQGVLCLCPEWVTLSAAPVPCPSGSCV